MLTQIVPPNTSTVGKVGYCLAFGEDVFSAPHNLHKYATEAWLAAKYKHFDRNMPNVSVPVWFTYWATIAGIYRNWGHIVTWVPGRGFLSSPLQQDGTQQWLASLEEVEKRYKCTFVGYSEDISGKRVVINKENDMPNNGDVDNVYLEFNGRAATDEEKNVYTHKDWSAGDGLYYGKVVPEVNGLKKSLADARAATNAQYEKVEVYRRVA
jgi:hypothetical protein